jgi:hypothetical protein
VRFPLHQFLRFGSAVFALLFLISAACAGQPAQDDSQSPTGEMIVNLAAGRVTVAVAKDAILIATVENPVEAGSRLPVPVQISESHIGIVLGAVEWLVPSTQTQLARLDLELPHLRGRAYAQAQAPHLATPANTEATDLETIGDGLLARLNELAAGLHSKIESSDETPFVALIVAGYAPQYGPEVWRLDYAVHQSEEAVGYFITRVSRPSYLQLWPPEKGQPKTLIEFPYLPGKSQEGLLELLRQNDPRLEKITTSDAQMAAVAQSILAGEINKVTWSGATQFFRAALDAITSAGARQSIAIIGEDSGFAWLLAPPVEATKPSPQPERPAGAPSLRHPSQ